MKKLNVALFGLGRFGKNYSRLLSEMRDEVEFRAVVTASSKERGDFTLPPSVIQTTDSSLVFNDPTIDSVIIVTPPSTHFELIKKSLESGKNVLVEKPMVLSIKEAVGLKSIVSRSGKVFMVGYQYVYNNYIEHIKQTLESDGGDGAKCMIMEHYLSPEPKDTNMLWEAIPHPLSIFEYMFRPSKILGVYGIMTKDFVSTLVKFDKGPLLQIIASWRGEKKVRMLRITRQNSLITFDDALQEDKLRYASSSGIVTSQKIQAYEPLKNEVENFIKCVREDSIPKTNFEFGLKVTKWLHEISNKLK